MKPLVKNDNHIGIAKRLLIYILLFSSVATLLLTSIQLYTEYKNDLNTFHSRFIKIEDAFKDGITQSYWTLNKEQTLLQLKGIQSFSGIDQVEILDPKGKVYMSLGRTPTKQVTTYQFPLMYSDRTVSNHHLGMLVLKGSRKNINKKLWERVANIIMSQTIKTFLVTVFILWLVYYMVTRHLLKIAEYVRRFSPEIESTPPLQLDRAPLDDELEILTKTINETQLKIKSDYQAIQEREMSLRKAVGLQHAAEILANYEKARALTTLSIIDDAILVTDRNSDIVLVNAFACQLFQTPKAMLIGQNIRTIEKSLSQGKEALSLDALSSQTSAEYAKAYLNGEDGPDIPVSITIRKIFPKQGELLHNSVIIICDLRQEQTTKKMIYLSTHDYLTNLPNRYSFEQAMKNIPKMLETSSYAALGMFDLDNFKIINDTCGHQAGDALLSQLATILGSLLPECATIYRLGGDEFGLLAHFDNINDIKKLGEQCRKVVRDYPFVWNHMPHSVSTSVGISILQRDTIDVHDLLIEADEACYRAKNKGGNCVVIQHAEDTARHANDIRSLNRLQHILRQPDLKLFAQPIMPCLKGTTLTPRLELLLRHVDENNRFYTPLNLIQAGERYGLITSIDHWVLQETFLHIETLIAAGWQININISPQALTNDRFLQLLERSLIHHNLPHGSICLEITERNIVTNISHTRDIMQQLHERGVVFALDDFGSGFASYGFIRHLPLGVIKIDGELIQNMTKDSTIHTMVNSIVTMSESMNIPVAAEYVTTLEELKILKKMKVSYIQGEVMSLARPVEYFYHTTPEELLEYL